MAALASAAAGLDAVAGIDAELDALGERLRALALEAEDLAGELRRYGEGVEGAAGGGGRLDEIEERLAVFERLKRKHGGTLAAVLAHAESCRQRRDELAGAEEAIEAAEAELAAARSELAKGAAALRKARVAAAEGLGAAVRERLAALAMEGATFEAALSERASPGRPAATRSSS